MDRIEYTQLIVETGRVGRITINRPEKRNALGTAPGGTIEQILQACDDMRQDPEVRVFIVSGVGDCFCSGFDLGGYDDAMFKKQDALPDAVKWVEPVKDEPWARYGRIRGDMSKPESKSVGDRDMFWDALWDNPKPSIAKVHSFCLGAGLWVANDCDVVYATPSAIFAYPPIRYGASVVLGIVPPWLTGRRQGMWMALTGHCVTADEAYNSGLITKIVDEDKIDAAVEDLADNIAKVPPVTHMASKRALNNYWENPNIAQAKRYGSAWIMMTENSAVPGHYFDFFELVRHKGVKAAYTEQRAKWGHPDSVMDAEVARLKNKK